MQIHPIQTLLTQDDIAAARIGMEYPAPFDREALFCRTMARYRGEIPAETSAPRIHRNIRQIVTTAACFLLIVGLGFGVWSRQQRVEVQPPEPPAVPVGTEPTEQTEPTETLRQSETTAPDTSHAVPEPDTTAPVIPETVSDVTDTAAASPMTEAIEPSAVPKPPAETAAPVIIPEETPAPTEAPAVPTDAPTEEIPESAAEQLTGFTVMQYKAYRRVICTDAFPTPDGTLQDYRMEGDALELIAASDEDTAAPVRAYEIRDPETGKVFTVTQQEYAEFALNVEEGELIDIGLSRVHGFFLLQDEQCTLYWFCEGEGFCVSGTLDDLGSLMTIVRSFVPAAETN